MLDCGWVEKVEKVERVEKVEKVEKVETRLESSSAKLSRVKLY